MKKHDDIEQHCKMVRAAEEYRDSETKYIEQLRDLQDSFHYSMSRIPRNMKDTDFYKAALDLEDSFGCYVGTVDENKYPYKPLKNEEEFKEEMIDFLRESSQLDSPAFDIEEEFDVDWNEIYDDEDMDIYRDIDNFNEVITQYFYGLSYEEFCDEEIIDFGEDY